MRCLIALVFAASLAGCGGGDDAAQPAQPDLGLPAAEAARACLEDAGLRVLAGNRSKGDTDAPDVELIVNDGPTMAFVALYESEARAKRYEPGIRRRAEEFGGSVEHQGAISILWVQEPSSDLRGRVEGCVFG